MKAIEAMAGRFDAGDDPDLWRVALRTILAEVEPGPKVRVEVGRCSHWLRPHQTRWTADGGFARPSGYGVGRLPEFDWSAHLGWDGSEWGVVEGGPSRASVRLAIPSRTRRHLQAAVHTLWRAGREPRTVVYGFRNRPEGWACTACSADEAERTIRAPFRAG